MTLSILKREGSQTIPRAWNRADNQEEALEMLAYFIAAQKSNGRIPREAAIEESKRWLFMWNWIDTDFPVLQFTTPTGEVEFFVSTEA